jgi:hypothetical protein
VRNQLGDRRETDALANLEFQRATFDDERLPLYVILDPLPDGKINVVGRYDEGKINSESAFAQFLRKPLEGNGGGLRAEARRN